MSVMVVLLALAGGCGTACPLPPPAAAAEVRRIVESGAPFEVRVEAVSPSGEVVHRARGPLVWREKHHIGGEELRGLGFDRPDYEVNSGLITPDKVWTSL